MDESNAARSGTADSPLELQAARSLLEGTERLRRTARADTQGLAIPLLVLGPLIIAAAALQRFSQWWMAADLGPGESRSASDGEIAFSTVVDTFWGTVGAAGLLLIGVWFAVRSRRQGVGAGSGAWIAAAVAAFVLVAYGSFPGVAPLFLPLVVVTVIAPSSVIAAALLLVAWRRHNGRLALWALAFGLVTVLASLFFFGNRLADLLELGGLSQDGVLLGSAWGDTVAQAALGVAMVVAGWRARRADVGSQAPPCS